MTGEITCQWRLLEPKTNDHSENITIEKIITLIESDEKYIPDLQHVVQQSIKNFEEEREAHPVNIEEIEKNSK